MAIVEDERVGICEELIDLQRERVKRLNSRIRASNHLSARVASAIAPRTGELDESDLKNLRKGADKAIAHYRKTGEDCPLDPLYFAGLSMGIEALEGLIKPLEKAMEKTAKLLDVADWVQEGPQRGFGFLGLAKILGETGDLSNYPNPAKVWKRMGCAPITKGDETLMGATWKARSGGKIKGVAKLTATEWEEGGYSPRRRSVMYVIAEPLLKGNGQGPYRLRYQQTKETYISKHPKETQCSKCEGAGETTKGECSNCKGRGYTKLRAHNHGMLLMSKLLLKNLWIEWNGQQGYVNPYI